MDFAAVPAQRLEPKRGLKRGRVVAPSARQAASNRPSRRDPAAQAPRPAGLLLGPALVGRLRHRAARARTRARRPGPAPPDAVGRCGGRRLLVVVVASYRQTVTPIRTAAERTPSAVRTRRGRVAGCGHKPAHRLRTDRGGVRGGWGCGDHERGPGTRAARGCPLDRLRREPSTRREFESLHERPGQLRIRTFSASN